MVGWIDGCIMYMVGLMAGRWMDGWVAGWACHPPFQLKGEGRVPPEL